MDSAEPPWYRQFWPWFIFGLPGIVVVAGLTTWWIAEQHADQLVADDYYKEGLAINEELRKQKAAEELGIEAIVEVQAEGVFVNLASPVDPPALLLRFFHPLDANMDFSIRLPRLRPGQYQAQLDKPIAYNWHWSLSPIVLPDPDDIPWQVDGKLTVSTIDGR